MDFPEFSRRAERGELPPVVLIHGADPQLVDDALAAAGARLFPDPTLTILGREVLDASEATVAEVVRSAMTLPLMTSARLVAVRHVQDWNPSPEMTEYVVNPNPMTLLLLLADRSLEASREHKRHWLLDVVPSSQRVTLPARQRGALADWLRQRAAQEGLSVSQEAARLLVEWVGDDTAALLGETRKAALVGASATGTVGVKDVTAVVGEQRLAGVFDLSRAIGRKDVGTALRTLDKLLASEEPMRLLGWLTGEVRLAWRVKELATRGQSAPQIAGALNRPAHVIEGWLAFATTAAPRTLAAHLRRCWEAELSLKSSGEARAELAALVATLCR